MKTTTTTTCSILVTLVFIRRTGVFLNEGEREERERRKQKEQQWRRNEKSTPFLRHSQRMIPKQ